MGIIKCDNGTIQVEFGEADVLPITLGLTTNQGVYPVIAIMPMHDAMTLKESKKKFTDFDIRLLFTNLEQVLFMEHQVSEAKRIMLARDEYQEAEAKQDEPIS